MEYYKYLRQYVGSKPLILPGSVVIIINDQNEILLQKRLNGQWALPGGLMNLGESFEEVAKREVLEETGLEVFNLTLMKVYSGLKYYVKNKNGDELYSITAVFYTKDVSGEMTIDYKESKDMKYFSIDHLPEDILPNYQEFIGDFIKLFRA